jgi:hypothetical protein
MWCCLTYQRPFFCLSCGIVRSNGIERTHKECECRKSSDSDDFIKVIDALFAPSKAITKSSPQPPFDIPTLSEPFAKEWYYDMHWIICRRVRRADKKLPAWFPVYYTKFQCHLETHPYSIP